MQTDSIILELDAASKFQFACHFMGMALSAEFIRPNKELKLLAQKNYRRLYKMLSEDSKIKVQEIEKEFRDNPKGILDELIDSIGEMKEDFLPDHFPSK